MLEVLITTLGVAVLVLIILVILILAVIGAFFTWVAIFKADGINKIKQAWAETKNQ